MAGVFDPALGILADLLRVDGRGRRAGLHHPASTAAPSPRHLTSGRGSVSASSRQEAMGRLRFWSGTSAGHGHCGTCVGQARSAQDHSGGRHVLGSVPGRLEHRHAVRVGSPAGPAGQDVTHLYERSGVESL